MVGCKSCWNRTAPRWRQVRSLKLNLNLNLTKAPPRPTRRVKQRRLTPSRLNPP